jgi:hypothetical protein
MKEETAEQLAQLRADYEAATDPKIKERYRGRLRRAESSITKAAKATETELAQVETIQDFWNLSLRGVDQTQLNVWKARREEVEGILYDIQLVLEGKQPDAEFITDVDDEIRADIQEHGIADITVPILLGKFWLKPELLAKLTSGEETPSSVFARFGILIGLPDIRLHQWDAFIAKHRGSKQPQVVPEVFYVSIRCSQCNGLPSAISSQIAAAYSRGAGYTCQSCIDKAAKARNFKQERYLPENANLLDSFGRVKDQ